MKTRIIAIFLVAIGCFANGKLATAQGSDSPLRDVFVSVLPQVKAETGIPILLPTRLPKPLIDAKQVRVAKATRNEYAVILCYELGVGDAGFAASFSAENDARYSPAELPNVRKARLAAGTVGFFRPVSCGGSCTPANLWWQQGATLYQIQLKLSSTLKENEQQKTITELANSAISAGPR